MHRRPFLPFLLAAGLSLPVGARAEMILTSTDMSEGGSLAPAQVHDGYGCTGGNRSPDLSWSGLPDGTRSLVVTAYDPDAPTGSGWWHWTVFNIPATSEGLKAGAGSGKADLPDGAVQGRTDFGQPGYGGACPPAGAAPHRYVFTLFALSVPSLPLDEQASGAMVGFLARANAIASASLTATYGR
jgi:hypothetical protein